MHIINLEGLLCRDVYLVLLLILIIRMAGAVTTVVQLRREGSVACLTGVVLMKSTMLTKCVRHALVTLAVGVIITDAKLIRAVIALITLKQTKTLACFAKVFVVRRRIMENKNGKSKCKITEKELIRFSRREISKKMKKDVSLFFEINFENVVNVDIVIKNVIKILKIANLNNLNFCKDENGRIVHEYIMASNGEQEKIQLLEKLFDILKMENFREIYSYIYDTICDDLDEKFSQNNYCDFKNDKCIAQRTVKTAHETMGCCYMHTYSKIMSMPIDLGLCRYLQNKKCSQECITCKFFTCKYLKKHDIIFSLEDYEIFKYFFNNKQKRIINESFFKTKEEIITLLMENL